MSAHPEKSVQVVSGDSKWVEKTITEMEENPSKIQNFELKRSMKEKYLGKSKTHMKILQMRM